MSVLSQGVIRTEAREMPPVFDTSCDSIPRSHSLPEIIDYNMKGEDADKSPEIEAIYSNNFFETMIDAVKDYNMIPNLPTEDQRISFENNKNIRTNQPLNTEDTGKEVNDSLDKLEVNTKTDEESTIDTSEQLNGDGPHGEHLLTNQGMTNGDLELEVINSEANEPKTVVSDNSIDITSRDQTNEGRDSTATTETQESPQKLTKRVQFSGLDTIFADSKDSESPNTTISEAISPNTSSSTKELSFSDNDEQKPSMEDSKTVKEPCPETVTWASLGSLSEVNGNDYEPANSSVIFDEENDQFMMYLNSIEQTALKFKLQVEQAKIDTLQILKKRLEQAYEGTPLEEIPAKVHDKLQETIAQIATEEVKKYESVLSSDMEEEFDDEECGILKQMRVELDSLAAENYRLTQELEDTKKYETEYHELQKKIEGMEDGLTSMKHDYATKNGESEFLGKRIEALEQEMISMRVEYEEQIRELQNQNIDLQKECLELDNENRALEDEIHRIQIGLSDHSNDEEITRVQHDDYLAERITAAELEAVEHRVNELERHNKALKAAGEADHAVVVCLEKKVEELEGSLNEAKSANSDLLTELHDSQRQQASDRAKLTSYREELEALKRENRVLKCSLETAENEVQYQKRRNERKKTDSLTRSPGSLGNKREIWNEIRELETILKDVQKEKVTIERKYKAFRQDSNEMKTSSLNNTPRSSTLNLSSPSCASPVSTTRSSPESTLTRPKKTSSLLERVNSLLEKSSLPNGTTLPHPTRDHVIKTNDENAGKSVGTPRGNEESKATATSVSDEVRCLL